MHRCIHCAHCLAQLKAALAPRHGVSLRDVDSSTLTLQQLGGSDYPGLILVDSSSGFDATRHSMQSPYYAPLCEANATDQEVLYPLHDFTTLALQRAYTAIDADIHLATAPPGIERVYREEWLSYQPVLGLSNGKDLYDTAPILNSPAERSKTPQPEPRAELSWPFRLYGGSRSYIQSPDERSRLPSGQTPSFPELKEDLQVMAPSTVSTNDGSADTAAGSLLYRQQLRRYHAGALTTHLNSFGVPVTAFGSGCRSRSGDLDRSNTNLASYEQLQHAADLKPEGPQRPSCDNHYESQSHHQHQYQLYSDPSNQIAHPPGKQDCTVRCPMVYPFEFTRVQQAGSKR
jgi:hypothetical protein